MVPVPSSTFGSFFDGDCYIVLAVSGLGREGTEQSPPCHQGGKWRLGSVGRAGQALLETVFPGVPRYQLMELRRAKTHV
jgi:hypothetical protein